jgi:hypothetical protein
MSLNIKVFINILLIILILSIVLNNIGLNIVIGRPSPFDVKQSDYPVGSMLENFDNDDAKKALEKYADKIAGMNRKEGKQARRTREQMNLSDTKVEKAIVEVKENMEGFTSAFPQMPVKPDNFFGLNEGSANFNSNVMDINKFYSNSFGDIEFKTPYKGNAGAGQLSAKQLLDGGVSGAPMAPRVDGKTANGTATFKPDMWQYKSELVMNGGNMFGDVSGYDGLDGGLAVYDGGAPIVGAQCSGGDMSGCKVANDDLRMGLGVPGREQRFTQ